MNKTIKLALGSFLTAATITTAIIVSREKQAPEKREMTAGRPAPLRSIVPNERCYNTRCQDSKGYKWPWGYIHKCKCEKWDGSLSPDAGPWNP
jgi:hypothetical protein